RAWFRPEDSKTALFGCSRRSKEGRVTAYSGSSSPRRRVTPREERDRGISQASTEPLSRRRKGPDEPRAPSTPRPCTPGGAPRAGRISMPYPRCRRDSSPPDVEGRLFSEPGEEIMKGSGAKRRHRSGSLKVAGGLVVLAALAFGRPAAAQTTGGSEVTFTKDVAPILQENCQICHQPGAIGPMSLMSYEEVRPWASVIRQRVVEREMPPYHYDTDVGIQELKEDKRLSREEIETIAAWVDA